MNSVKYFAIALLTLLISAVVPISISYAQNQEERVDKFVELAERAKDKTENLINITYANQTALDTILDNFEDELNGNMSLFNRGVDNLTMARQSQEYNNYEGAVANATEAMSIFREVYKAFNTIFAESGVQRGQLVDAQGLIQVMKRTLDRIERLREIAEGTDDSEVLEILGSAEDYLDVETALTWLLEGNVNGTAHNITQANKLLSEAYKAFKKTAENLNIRRIESYLKVINNFYNRLSGQVNNAIIKELESGAELNATLVNDAKPLIELAEDYFQDGSYGETMETLTEARDILEVVEQGLKEARRS
jgi:flagellin-specific chaperone FliS